MLLVGYSECILVLEVCFVLTVMPQHSILCLIRVYIFLFLPFSYWLSQKQTFILSFHHHFDCKYSNVSVPRKHCSDFTPHPNTITASQSHYSSTYTLLMCTLSIRGTSPPSIRSLHSSTLYAKAVQDQHHRAPLTIL